MLSFARRVVLITLAIAAAASAESRVDDRGQLERLGLGVGWLSPRSDVRLPTKGWGRSVYLGNVRSTAAATADGRAWTADLSHDSGPAVRLEQRVRYKGEKVVFDVRATGVRDGDIEGVIFTLNVPAPGFAGGALKVAGQSGQSAPLPKTLGENNNIWGGTTAALRFDDARAQSAICVATEPAAKIVVQDGRRWGNEFTAMIYVHSGNLPAGQSASLRITVYADGQIDQSPAHVRINPDRPGYTIRGIGGNYCFSIESPVTRYTLDHLKVAAARTEMSIRSWAAKEAPGDPSINDPKLFSASDQPDSRIRHEMELMRELTAKKIPFTLSIWRMPAYMTLPAGRGGPEKRKIGEAQWPRVLQAIGTYLLYARDKYHAEPDYFSFNEPDIGIDILFSAEEHRDAIKRLGAHFAKLGLKTRCLAGDTGNARGTHKYVLPTVQGPEALKYVGAIAFHSWNGARPDQYAAWAEVAERVKLPLICNEAGVDPAAWQGGKYRTFAYGMREMIHYQELFQHASPQSIVFWEFTADYSLMQSDRPTGRDPVVTERLCLQKHWVDLTPPGSRFLPAENDNDNILATAFRTSPAGDCTIHLANAKWPRPVELAGLPANVTALKVVRTAKDELFKSVQTISVKDGRTTVTLPAESLTSLTTLEVGQIR